MRSASTICAPIDVTGFSDVDGFWKTKATSPPSSARRSDAGMAATSRPSNSARPSRILPPPGSRPKAPSSETLLPEPDSPTIPSVSPSRTCKEIAAHGPHGAAFRAEADGEPFQLEDDSWPRRCSQNVASASTSAFWWSRVTPLRSFFDANRVGM